MLHVESVYRTPTVPDGISPQGEPCRLWSLWDMKPFDTAAVASSIAALAESAGLAMSVGIAELTAENVLRVIEAQFRQQNPRVNVQVTKTNLGGGVATLVHGHIVDGLQAAEAAIQDAPIPSRLLIKLRRIREEIAKEEAATFDAHAAKIRINDLALDMLHELKEPKFIFISSEHRPLYEQQTPPFGADVEGAFPDASRDIAAACRCLALDEWTACVFHLMRVLEHGLRLMATRFQVPFATDSWHKVIKGIEDGLTALRNKQGLTDQDRREITYYSDAAAQFRHFKDAWRNHVSHAREHYDERDAEKVFAHVRELMQHLVTPV